MNSNGLPKILFSLIILSLIAWAYLDASLATGLNSDEYNLSSIKSGWTKSNGDLIGNGPGLAGYGVNCVKEPLTLKFGIENLTGGINAIINMKGSDRYAIGFVNTGNNSLYAYLLKQLGANASLSGQQALGESKIYNQTRMIYNKTQKYQVEIVSDNGHILVLIYDAGQKFGARLPVIDYHDSAPLPPGKIDFETLKESSVLLSDVTTNCSSAIKDKLPNLGVGYFKRPDPTSLANAK